MKNAFMPLIAVCLLLSSTGTANAQRGGGGGGGGAICMPADSVAAWILQGLQRVSADQSSEGAATRERRKLPLTTASQVTYVTDNAVCASAEKTYTANVTGSSTPSGSVYVFKIKDVYMVADTGQKAGEYVVTMTLSKQFKLLARYHQ